MVVAALINAEILQNLNGTSYQHITENREREKRKREREREEI